MKILQKVEESAFRDKNENDSFKLECDREIDKL
jgi:hypothetical protein